MAFQYEKNLRHQEYAIEAVVESLDGCHTEDKGIANGISIDKRQLLKNVQYVQTLNETQDVPPTGKPILDIDMETGTGKTYTYAKTMFELHREYGAFKFIVAVPTLSIKAGTENFLQSEALAKHFRLDFEGRYG